MAWCKFPSRWIRDRTLTGLTWSSCGGDGTAALLLLVAIAVRINQATIDALREEPGQPVEPARDIQLTYDELADMTGISRPKVSSGLKLLKEHGLVTAVKTGRTMRYALPQILTQGDWCQFPQTWIYRHKVLEPFMGFRLREKWELQALKVYLVLLTFKHNGQPLSQVSYTAIENYTGVVRSDIRKAIDHLINLGLIGIQIDPAATTAYSGNVYVLNGFQQRRRPSAVAAEQHAIMDS